MSKWVVEAPERNHLTKIHNPYDCGHDIVFEDGVAEITDERLVDIVKSSGCIVHESN